MSPTRPDLLQAEYDAACERIGDLLADLEKAEATKIELAEHLDKTVATAADAVMRANEAEAERDRLEANCAAKDAALEKIADRNTYIQEVGNARAGPQLQYAMKIARQALSDNPGAALLAERDRLIAQVKLCKEFWGQALRQWRMHAELTEDRDLKNDSDPEAELYRSNRQALDGQKEPDDA